MVTGGFLMGNSSIKGILQKAKQKLKMGDCKNAYLLLEPLLSQKNPEALFLYSTFSLHDMETDSQFEVRSINLLKEASEAGYAPATYALAVCYEYGDLIEQNCILAATLYKKAAEAGYSKAKLDHGLNLFYGSNGIPKEKHLGLTLIKQAILERVDGAAEILGQLEKQTDELHLE
jgi:TPR repeat protein